MNLLTILVVLLSVVSTTVAIADSPAPPLPKVTASQLGITYFKMIPDREIYNGGFGVAYSLNDDGSSTELWRVNGWYAFEVFISNDGVFLVRMGNWADGAEPSEEDLAVSFYKNGAQIRSYSTKDLIQDKISVMQTVSHYMWRMNDKAFPKLSYNNKFHLKTIEGVEYVFDVSTGEIVNEASP